MTPYAARACAYATGGSAVSTRTHLSRFIRSAAGHVCARARACVCIFLDSSGRPLAGAVPARLAAAHTYGLLARLLALDSLRPLVAGGL